MLPSSHYSDHIFPHYEHALMVAEGIWVITANNPSEMTLEGTNTWIISSDTQRSIVIDPGPNDRDHIDCVARTCGMQPIILLSHQHNDHSAGLNALIAATGGYYYNFSVPLNPYQLRYHHNKPGHITDDNNRTFIRNDMSIRTPHGILCALKTPGHTNDSLTYVYSTITDNTDADKFTTSIAQLNNGLTPCWNDLDNCYIIAFTGDTILGSGSTILLSQPNPLGQYLHSLTLLQQLPAHTVMASAHGMWGESLHNYCQKNITHRKNRLQQISAELQRTHTTAHQADPIAITQKIYTDIPENLFSAAVHNVKIQLEYLATQS